MESDIAVVTYLYPRALAYFKDFLHSLEKQTCQNFQLIIFNDGVSSLPEIPLDISYQLFKAEGTPLEIRLNSLEILKGLNYKYYIFNDADDSMSDNRVGVVGSLLKENQIVVNDLNTMSADGCIINDNIWANRAKELKKISVDSLNEKNFLGLGNTGVRADLLSRIKLKTSDKPLAADWFIFYQYLFYARNTKVVFTSACQTNYRQHQENTAGIQELTTERFEHVVKVKKMQYAALAEIGIDSFKRLKECNFEHNTQMNDKTPFWWEEITICKK